MRKIPWVDLKSVLPKYIGREIEIVYPYGCIPDKPVRGELLSVTDDTFYVKGDSGRTTSDLGNLGLGYYLNIYDKNTMSSPLEFFRNLTASPEDLLLKKHGLEEPIGTPTAKGLELANAMNYAKKRNRIIELCKDLEAAENAKCQKACDKE